jgi:protein O-GlcNAc transferase
MAVSSGAIQSFELALAHQRAGRLPEAEAACRQALQSQSGHADVMNLLGIVLCQMHRVGEGVEFLRSACALRPDHAVYLTNLGNALATQGDIDGAIAEFKRALSLVPELPDAWNNLGNAIQERGDAREAIVAHRRAIDLRPDYVQAHYNLAAAYKMAGMADQAIASYDQALTLAPAYAKAEVNRANILKDIGRLDEAIAGYQRGLRISPSAVTAGNLIYCLYFHPDYDAQRIHDHLLRWNGDFAAPLAREILPHGNDRSPSRRIRVGYVSPDFSEHPAGRFLLPLLANHDHTQMEVFCYSDLRRPDDMTHRLRACADTWRDTFSLDDARLAEQIRADRIDILVDLAQHLANNRLLCFARKPAPIQTTWLGYPGSTGLESIDYRLSDRYLDPPSTDSTGSPQASSGPAPGLFDAFYSEKTIRLPDSYWCYDPLLDPIEVGPLPAAQNGFVTFGCLNNFAKVTEPAIRLWAQAMSRVAGSRLLILTPTGSARTRFADQLEIFGIAPSRVEFVDRMSRRQYMALYQRIDISLDTWPCNGHTTSFDSIWMGVPLITLTGQTAMSRGGASVLGNLGLAEFIADVPAQYVDVAAALATDRTRLAALRAELRGRIERSSLMDGNRFARNFEAIYRKVWQDWCADSR